MIVNSSGSTFVSMPDIPLNLSTLEVSEELLCRPPEQRKEDDILGILPWIRHKSSLFKNLEDGNDCLTTGAQSVWDGHLP